MFREEGCVCVYINLFHLSFSNRDFRFCKSNEKDTLHKRQILKREGERERDWAERDREAKIIV